MIEEPLNIIRELIEDSSKKILVCIGNELRGDDEVGVHIGRRLKKTSLKDNVILAYNTPENHIQEILEKDVETVIFFDAVDVKASPGTIILQEILPDKPSYISISTHSIPIETIVSIIQSLSGKKMRFYIIGVQAKNLDFGSKMSKEVVYAAKKLTEMIVKDIESK
ncbi:MAG: hydrogenase maturation protease [Nitrososphaeria archaeon]